VRKAVPLRRVAAIFFICCLFYFEMRSLNRTFDFCSILGHKEAEVLYSGRPMFIKTWSRCSRLESGGGAVMGPLY
jgi:hypothetical protein